MRFPFQVYAPTPLDCLQHHKITNLKTIPKSYYQFPEKLHRGRDIVKFSFKSGSCQKETSQETEVAAGDKLEATGLEAARPEKTRFSSAENLPPTEFFVKETFLPAFRDANLWASKAH